MTGSAGARDAGAARQPREWLAVLGIGALALVIAALIVLTPWHPAALLHRTGAQRGPERIVSVTVPTHPRPVPAASAPAVAVPVRPAPTPSPSDADTDGVDLDPTATTGDPR